MTSEAIGGFQATYCTERQNPSIVDALFKFRKTLFVDALGWTLDVQNGRERDQFDTEAAVYCALFEKSRLVGGFRAIRTDSDYLARSIFPHLAKLKEFPQRPDVWEISRFGVLPGQERRIAAKINYSLMFHFAQRRAATSLVAVVDLTYERFLGLLGIRTRRYGPPQVIGNARGAEIWAVAGEIPLAEQTDPRFHAHLALTKQVEINDDTLVLGRRRVSA
jgi:acyl homoserine lactone synthase